MHLSELTQIDAVSGNEGELSDFIIKNIREYVDAVKVDSMGNIIAYKKGRTSRKRVLLCAHMDEVGFIVSNITDTGFIKFKSVGGLDERTLLSKRVRIGKDKVDGVIGIKAVHLQDKEEQKKVIKLKDMYIDIGAKSKEDALKYVSLGDYIALNSEYREMGDNIKAKAIDDRVGCLALIELIKRTYENDFYFCFSVQEEVGLRGSKVVAHRLKVDTALNFEATGASDVPFSEPHEYNTCLGEGPAISIMDRTSYSNKNLNKFICDLADSKNLKYQFKKSSFGGNDAGSLQVSGGACQTAVISLPCRYIHTPVCMISKNDLKDYLALIECVLDNLYKYQN